jgi:uncharacterized protein
MAGQPGPQRTELGRAGAVALLDGGRAEEVAVAGAGRVGDGPGVGGQPTRVAPGRYSRSGTAEPAGTAPRSADERAQVGWVPGSARVDGAAPAGAEIATATPMARLDAAASTASGWPFRWTPMDIGTPIGRFRSRLPIWRLDSLWTRRSRGQDLSGEPANTGFTQQQDSATVCRPVSRSAGNDWARAATAAPERGDDFDRDPTRSCGRLVRPGTSPPMAASHELDWAGRSALHYAAAEADVAAVRELIAQGLDVGLADRQGYTPLHFAAEGQRADVVAVLIAAGADVDARDAWGNTALGRAVVNFREDGATIVALLDAGADPHAENNYGNSPQATAEKIANYDVARYFHR